MTPDQLVALKRDVESAEGRIGWIYLDTRGNPTVAIGHLLPTFSHAFTLPFSPMLTKDEWERVCAALAGLRASAYKLDTQARLSDAKMDALLDADIKVAQEALRQRFREYSTWPNPADAAATDLAFNLGIGGLTQKFPKLTAAIKAMDWATCAVECHRSGISDIRNERTADLFREAASA